MRSSRGLSPGSSYPQAPERAEGWIPATSAGMTVVAPVSDSITIGKTLVSRLVREHDFQHLARCKGSERGAQCRRLRLESLRHSRLHVGVITFPEWEANAELWVEL